MKITRTINGEEVDIELTAEELSAAYYEQEHNFDVQDVQSRFNGEITDSELEEIYGVTPEQITDEVIENIAYEARRNMDKYDMEHPYAIDAAVKDILNAINSEVT